MNSPSKKAIRDSQDEDASCDDVSLEVLCRRANRLMDSIRMMGEQVSQVLARPERMVTQANETARELNELKTRVEARLADARQTHEAICHRTQEMQSTLSTVQNAAAGLVQRVQRAREVSEVFGKLMDASADRIGQIESAAGEARQVREAIAKAIAEMNRVQQVADNWTASVTGLASRYAELIASGNAAASRLRTLTDAGDRLRESVRQDVVNLRELLRESRTERAAWEELLARAAASAPAATNEAASRQSVATSLANRVRRLADYVRQSSGAEGSNAVRRQASGNRLSAGVVENLNEVSKI